MFHGYPVPRRNNSGGIQLLNDDGSQQRLPLEKVFPFIDGGVELLAIKKDLPVVRWYRWSSFRRPSSRNFRLWELT